ncbi:MAG: 50S ribosomal protein L22 [Nanoarchaeota archaeon]
MGYAFTKQNEHTAQARGLALPISSKHAIEICNMIRGKDVSKAKELLERVIKKHQAVAMRRFSGDTGHKPGMGPGRYPVKAASEILKIIKHAEANAQVRGLNTASMKIVHLCANRGARPMRHGRKGGVQSKRTHIEIVVEETEKRPAAAKKVKKTETPQVAKPKDLAPDVKPADGVAQETPKPVQPIKKTPISEPAKKKVTKPVKKESPKTPAQDAKQEQK